MSIKTREVDACMSLDKTIKTLRLERGWTQDALARKIEITPKMISFYELGERTPSRATLIKLADVFSVSLDTLVNSDNKDINENEPRLSDELARDIKEIFLSLGVFKDDKNITREEYNECLRFMRAQAKAFRELNNDRV